MTRIANETEKVVKSNVEDTAYVNISDAVSKAIQRICQSMPIHKVVTLTQVRVHSADDFPFKISQPVIAVTPDLKVKRQLELIFGVEPVLINYLEEKDRVSYVGEPTLRDGVGRRERNGVVHFGGEDNYEACEQLD